MIATRHYINGVEIRPKNADNIGFKLDFVGNWQEAELSVDSIVLEREARDMVMDHVNSLGLTEGLPYQVGIGSLLLDYYIDFTDNPRFTDSSVEVTIKRRKAVDWFKQQADGLSFELLNVKQPITGIFDVPYIIVKDNQVELLIMLSITTYTLTKEVIQAVKDLATATADLIQAITPDVPPAAKIGDIIALSIRVAAQVVYTALLIIALINLVQQIIELILPKVRNLKANTFRNLITQGCSYLGLSFSSSLTELDFTCLPVPLQKTNKSIFDFLFNSVLQSYNKGYPTALDTVPTLGTMIDEVCTWLNAEYRIVNGTVIIENDEYWQNQSGATITTTLNIQQTRENAWTYNVDEMFKRHYLHYAYDSMDSHTMDRIDGIAAEYNTDAVTVVNSDLVTIKNLYERSVNLSLGARKNQLNAVEKVLLVLAKSGDSVVNTLGGNSSLAAKVVNRIGVLQISNQFFTITKVLNAVGGKQPANYMDRLNAKYIYDTHHSVNDWNNAIRRIESGTVRFAPNQFQLLLNNNFVQDQYGNDIKILTFEWINESREANIMYTLASDIPTNTQTTWIN